PVGAARRREIVRPGDPPAAEPAEPQHGRDVPDQKQPGPGIERHAGSLVAPLPKAARIPAERGSGYRPARTVPACVLEWADAHYRGGTQRWAEMVASRFRGAYCGSRLSAS